MQAILTMMPITVSLYNWIIDCYIPCIPLGVHLSTFLWLEDMSRNVNGPMWEFQRLNDSIEEAVRKGCEGRRVGVACSGGLDSGLVSALAKRYAQHVTLYTCGTKNSFDVKAGKELAERLNLQWVHCKLTKAEMPSLIREFVKATGDPDPFTVSYEMQLFTVCREAEEDVILTGQGSDEYFGGNAIRIPGLSN